MIDTIDLDGFNSDLLRSLKFRKKLKKARGSAVGRAQRAMKGKKTPPISSLKEMNRAERLRRLMQAQRDPGLLRGKGFINRTGLKFRE